MGTVLWREDKGAYYIRYDSPPGLDGKRHQHMVSAGKGTSEEDARLKLREIELQLNQGIVIDSTNDTVAQYMAKWMDLGKMDRSPSTHERYEQLLRYYIVPVLGKLKLSKLRPIQIQSLLNTLRVSGRRDGKDGGLAPKTVKHVHTLLRAALNQAVRWQILATNPAASVQPPKVPKPKIKVASQDDIAKLLVSISRSYFRLPILIALATGMRRGEVCALKFEDFDPDTSTLLVRRSFVQTSKEFIEKGTKTDRARAVLLPAAISAEISALQQSRQAAPGDYISLNANGGRLAPKSLDKAYRRLRTKVGVEVTLHGLRHTQATQLILAGVPVKTVADRLGHSTVAVTQDIYAHVMPQHQQGAVDVVEKMLDAKPSIKVVECTQGVHVFPDVFPHRHNH